MKDFAWITSFYCRQFFRALFLVNRDKLIKNLLLLLFAVIFFPMVYQLFKFIFRHFYDAPLIGGILVSSLMNTFYLSFSLLILLSSIVTSISVLFLSRDMDFLFSRPLREGSLFAFQYLKIIAGSCWMVFLMSVPIFGAFGSIFNLSMGQYLFMLLNHLPLFVIMTSVGIVITLLLLKSFPAENVRNIAIAVSGIFVAAFLVYFRMLQPEKLTGASTEQIRQFIENFRTPDSLLLPHGAFMHIINRVTGHGVLNTLLPSVIFFSVSAVCFYLVIETGKKMYFEAYGKKGLYTKQGTLSPGFRFHKAGQIANQIKKDFLYLVRDTAQWIQVVFLFGLVVIYLFNMYKLPDQLFNLRNVIYFLNIGFIGFVMSAIGARLVLPVISSEGRGFWIYRSAPFALRNYVLYKLVAYGLPVMATGLVVAGISLYILKADSFVVFLTIFSTFCATLVISGVGTGFGAYFADFSIKNPEEMITGVAGLAYMFATFIFIGLLLWFEAGAVRDYYVSTVVNEKTFHPEKYIPEAAAIIGITLAFTILPMIAGIKKLEKMEK